MIPLVDLIIVIQRFYSKELGIKRRVTEISEVSRMDNKVLLGNIYDFDETLDQAKRTEVPSRIMDVLSNQLLVSKIDLKKEIDTRKLILEWMIKKDIRKPNEVLEFIQTYYYRPDKVLQMIKSNK